MAAMEPEKEEIHVLMVSFSSQGHINPMLQLGKRLISKGLHVTLATTELVRHRILQSSSSDRSTAAGIQLAFFSDGFSLDYDRGSDIDHFMDTLGAAGPINLSALVAGRKFSCFICNPFVPWVADVAAEHGIPCAMLWIQPAMLFAIYYRFYNNLNPFPTSENHSMSVELPGIPVLKTEDLPSFVLPSNPFGSFQKLLAGLFQNMNKMKWVLCNSFYELEKDAVESMSEINPIRPIGPLVPPAILGEDQGNDVGIEMWKSEDRCIEWLNRQPPSSVIYVSFGSIIVLSEKQMGSIATALKNIERPFLWVVKPPDGPKKSGDHGQPPLGFSEETKGQGLIVPWSPQTKVLLHPSVGCFLSHCGWNSTLEAFASGVPVIAFPQWTDQPTNAKLIADVLRVGVRLLPNREDGLVSHKEVERCIEEVMSEPGSEEFKKNAAELKVAAREAVANGGSSDRNIQLFVDEIIANCSRA